MDAETLKKSKRKKLFIIIGIAVAVAIVLFFVVRPALMMRSAMSEFDTMPQTTILERTNLEKSVTATGRFESATSRTVYGTASYEVTEIYVSVGDMVTEGQPLCQLDTSELDEKISDARESVSDAEAQDALEKSQAQGDYDRASADYSGRKGVVDSTYAALQTAQSNFDAAAAAGTTTNPYEQALADAQAAYDEAVRNKNSSSESVRMAQEQLDTLNLKDSAKTARQELDTLLTEREDCTILAPISGTVTAVGAEVGLAAGSSPSSSSSSSGSGATGLFDIQDLSHLEVPASVPEYDAVLLSPGLTVHITSDTFEDKSWSGTVKSVTPVATDTSGNFTVTVTLDGVPEDLTPGMSAKLEIVVESKQNVFAVPYDAVVTKDDGSKVVYAMQGMTGFSSGGGSVDGAEVEVEVTEDFDAGGDITEGLTVPGEGTGAAQSGSTGGAQSEGADQTNGQIEIPVTTGMETDYLVEISGAGLYEGMVILSDPSGQNVGGQSDMMMFGMGGGGNVAVSGPSGGGGGVERRVEIG